MIHSKLLTFSLCRFKKVIIQHCKFIEACRFASFSLYGQEHVIHNGKCNVFLFGGTKYMLSKWSSHFWVNYWYMHNSSLIKFAANTMFDGNYACVYY